MSGRRVGARARKRTVSPKSRASSILTDYVLKATSGLDFASMATGADKQLVLVDHSSDIGAQPARVVKLKTQMMWLKEVVDERHLIQAVYRNSQGSNPLALDVQSTVRNATQDGLFYRRPFLTHTNVSSYGAAGHMDHFMKPLVLKNVLLDEDDDLLLGFTNPDSAFSATAQSLMTRTEFWWKRV